MMQAHKPLPWEPGYETGQHTVQAYLTLFFPSIHIFAVTNFQLYLRKHKTKILKHLMHKRMSDILFTSFSSFFRCSHMCCREKAFTQLWLMEMVSSYQIHKRKTNI